MNHDRKKVLSLAAISALATASFGLSDAMAQEPPAPAPASPSATPQAAENEDEGNVVVTARRREERLLDVPIAMTYASGERLEDAGIVDTEDLIRIAPGLVTSASSTRGYDHLGVSIRAQRNGEAAITSDPSVGIYFVEVPQNAPQGLNQAFFDLQSVQVLRGPQGTLFGRNATGGAVLIEPHMPGEQFGGFLRVARGDYDYGDYEGALDLPVADNFRLRVAGRHTRRDGYMTNVMDGREYNDIDRWGARVIADWQPTPNLSTVTIATTANRDSSGDVYRLRSLSPLASGALVTALNFTQTLGEYETSYNVGLPGDPIQNPRSEGEVWSIQNTTTYDLGDRGVFTDLQLKNIIGYRDVYDLTISSPSGSYVPTQDQVITDEITELSEELQLSGGLGNFDWLIGLYYFTTEGSEVLSQFNNGVDREQVTHNDVNNSNYSVFAHLDYDLSSVLAGLSVSLGGRWNHDEREVIRRSRVQNAVGSALYTCSLPPANVGANSPSLCSNAFQAEYEEPTWETSLNWEYSPTSLLYASYRRGYRTGGFSPSRPTTLADAGRTFDPELLDAYEIGWKNAFRTEDARGTFTVAGFYYGYDDVQRRTTFLVGPGATSTLTFNAASATVTGAEAEFHVRLYDHLVIDLTYANVNPVYDEFYDTVVVSGVSYQHDISDSIFNEISEHQASVGITYEVPLEGDNGLVSFGGTYFYRSSYTTMNEINTAHCTTPASTFYNGCYNRAGIIPGYGVMNLRVDWEDVLGRGFDLSLFVNNATDNHYQTNAVTVLSSLGFFSTGIGAPRMWGAQARVAF